MLILQYTLLFLFFLSLIYLVRLGVGYKFSHSQLTTSMCALLGSFFCVAFIQRIILVARLLWWPQSTEVSWVAHDLVLSSSENLPGWRSHSLAGQPLRMLCCCHCERLQQMEFSISQLVLCRLSSFYCVPWPCLAFNLPFGTGRLKLNSLLASLPRLTKPRSLSRSLSIMCSSSLAVLVTLHWTHTRLLISLFYEVTQNYFILLVEVG